MTREKTEAATRLEAIEHGPWNPLGELAREEFAKVRGEIEKRERKIASWLKPHWKKAVPAGRVMDIRDSFDELLTELQLLELAYESSYLSLEDIEPRAVHLIDNFLWSRGSRKFLRDYEYVTVRWLGQRMGRPLDDQRWDLPEPTAGESRFASFLAELQSWYEDGLLDRWLGFLDDYHIVEDESWHFARLLKNKAPPPEIAQELAKLVEGAQTFITRTTHFFRPLSHVERASYGSFFAYWLAHFFAWDLTDAGYVRDNDRYDWGKLMAEAGAASGDVGAELQESICELREIWSGTARFIDRTRGQARKRAQGHRNRGY